MTEQPTSVDDVCRALVAKYDAAEDVIVPQVLSFLKELRQREPDHDRRKAQRIARVVERGDAPRFSAHDC